VRNALAAASAAEVLGLAPEAIASGIAAADAVPGRFEPVDEGQPFRVLVDFAHTPAGIQRVLATARELAAERRVIVVVGAGGDRDRSKRALMGAAAEHGADVVFVTNDNPRSEDPGAIASDLLSGMDDPDRAHVVLDRREAIDHALDAARPGDVVIVAGKGHERVQIVGGESTAFDDRQVAGDLLAQRGWVS
jgi:UDP-N-acetylmuramoyl-L-alanyl-D-glutamate--2,6-diaminopimelate ligase